MLRCSLCRRALDWLHGHAACLHSECPLYGLNQSECCSGETMESGWVPTSDLAAPSCVTEERSPEDGETDRGSE